MKRGVVLIIVVTALSLLLAMIFVTSAHLRSSRRALDEHLEMSAARAQCDAAFQRAAGELSRGGHAKIPSRARFDPAVPLLLVRAKSNTRLAGILRLPATGRPDLPPRYVRAEAQLEWKGSVCRARLLHAQTIAWNEAHELDLSGE